MQEKHSRIIKGCIKGDQKAQIQLYDQYCDAMFSIACRYLKNEEDAKDAMQEGFLKAFCNIKNYQANYSFGAWIKRIIINTCIDFLRKQKLEFTDFDTESIEIIEDEDWTIDVSITKAMIIKAIDQLAEKHQFVVKLYLIDGYTHEEISQILQIPIQTSRTHLRRGRLQLKNLLITTYNEARY